MKKISSNGDDRKPLHEGYLMKVSRRISGRAYMRKRYFICQGPCLYCYKTEESWRKRERAEKIYRVDTPEGYVEDLGWLEIRGKHYHCVTMLYRSVTTGELKHLKFGTSQPEDAAKWKRVLLQARQDAMNKPQSSGMDRNASDLRTQQVAIDDSSDESIDPNEADPTMLKSPRRNIGGGHHRSSSELPQLEIENETGGGGKDTNGKTTARPGEVSPVAKSAGSFCPSKCSLAKVEDSSTGRKVILRQGTCGTMPPEMDAVQEHLNNMRRMPDSERDLFTKHLVNDEDDNDDNSEDSEHDCGESDEFDPWRLIKVENGLRFFEDCSSERCGPVPCMKAVGRVRAPPDAVFKLLMDITRSRRKWDITFSHGRLLETVDGHSDVIHLVYRPLTVWPLWPQPAPRDLCLRRYWRREDDGTYMILLRSHIHPDCPEQKGYVRADLAGGGFVISPLQQRGSDGPASRMDDSLVMQILEMTPGGWLHPRLPFARNMYHQILLATGAIREAFDQMTVEFMEKLWEEPMADAQEEEDSRNLSNKGLPLDSREQIAGAGAVTSEAPSSASEEAKAGASSPSANKMMKKASKNKRKTQQAALKKMVGRYGSMPHIVWPPPNGNKNDRDLWGVSMAPASLFNVRSKTYLTNKKKQTAYATQMELIDTDFFTSDKRIINTSGRKDGIVQQKLLKQEGVAFIFAVNIQVQANVHYCMTNYYAMSEMPDPNTLLGKFIYGNDDAFRNARFKMIPLVTKGTWVVQRAVGSTPFIVGAALKVDFHQGERYFEVGVNVGSSSVANTVLGIVAPAANHIVVDIAYVIQGDTEAELPEKLLATTRICHLKWEEATPPPPEEFV